MKLGNWPLAGLIVGVVALAPGIGCGGGSERTNPDPGRTTVAEEGVSEYEEVLGDFQAAASEGESYDAYGFAEYFPATQRAAVHAFCFVADQLQKNPTTEELADPQLTQRVTRKAEADLKSERDIVAPRPARKAIGKLHAVLGLESLDPGTAESYVRACYR